MSHLMGSLSETSMPPFEEVCDNLRLSPYTRSLLSHELQTDTYSALTYVAEKRQK